MNIVIIANDSNGLYLFRRDLISALIEQGHKVTALTPFDTDVDNLKKLGAFLMETPIDRRGTNFFTDFFLMKLYYTKLKQIKPDMVITYTIKPNVYGGLVCQFLKIPYVSNITGLGSAFENRGIIQNLVTFLNKYALKKAKIIFFENTENRNVFVKKRIVEKKRTHVLNGAGVDIKYFSYQKYPTDTDETRFLFVGRVMKEKGINELFKAMRRLRTINVNCSLDVVGEFEENYEYIIKRFEKEGWLRYHGFQKDVRPFINNCHCFVLPSWHEGMANTNLECAAMGRPVITSNIHGCLEAVEDGVSGLLCKRHNTDDLFKVMNHFANLSLEQRINMGLEGRKRMEDIFDKKKVVGETLRFMNLKG